MERHTLRFIFFCLILISPNYAEFCAAKDGSAAAKTKPYRLLKTIPLPNEDSYGRLTIDSAARRLYIIRGKKITVMDTDNYAVAGEIARPDGVNSLTIAGELGRGFTTSRSSNTISIFDTSFFTTIGEVRITKKIDSMLYDPASRLLFIFLWHQTEAIVIDALSGAVAGTVPLGGQAQASAADGKGKVYVNLINVNKVAVIDSQTLDVTAHWPLAPCAGPVGMALDAVNKRLFSSCKNGMTAVVNTDTGIVISTIPIGPIVSGIAFDPETGLLFNSDDQGKLAVTHADPPDKFSPAGTIKVSAENFHMALDSQTHRVFLITADYDHSPANISVQAGLLTPTTPESGIAPVTRPAKIAPDRPQKSATVMEMAQKTAPDQPQQNRTGQKLIQAPGTVKILVLGK